MSPTAKRKPGRPKGSGAYPERLQNISLSAGMTDRLREKAAAEGISIASLVRRAIAAALD